MDLHYTHLVAAMFMTEEFNNHKLFTVGVFSVSLKDMKNGCG